MSHILNVNMATLDELAALPEVDEALAESIVNYRANVGLFRKIEELLAVEGMSDRILERIRDRVSVEDVDDGEHLPPLEVLVVCVSTPKDDYTGHRVIATFTRREWIADDEGRETATWLPALQSAELPSGGEVRITFPNRGDLQGDVTFRVQAPDGEVLHTAMFRSEDLPEKVELQVKPKRYAKIEPNNDPNFGKPARLKGRVIDASGRTQIAHTQVVVWGAVNHNPIAADFRPLLAAQTDANGYFAGPYPLGKFTSAHGSVAILEEPVSVPIHLQDDGTFPESVILVVEIGKKAPGEEEECECHKKPDVPRDPDASDLGRADGTYSTDPGAGKCVDFTKPDRTLEEFSFSYVVRTTEPVIKGLTFTEPPKVDISKFIKLIPVGVTPERAPGPGPVETGGSAPARAPLATKRIDARMLRTLARDPDGFSLTNVAAAAERTVNADVLRLIGQHLRKYPGRGRLSCDNPVDWDDEPTIYQACTIAHGHVLRFKQEWVADGYSMGNLLYSLPLGPGQRKQIAVVDWERRESASRSEFVETREELDAAISRDRDINEIVNATVSESVRGGSKAKSGGFAAGLGIGAIVGPVGGLLGIGGGTSSARSDAWQNSSRSTAASALNQLRDRTIQSASSLRSQRSTVIQAVRQGERVTASTETVANYNHCHAITIQYFEVLRHLLIRQRLVDVQECLFVPLLMSRFTSEKALRWRNTLRGCIANRYLRTGFDALERIQNAYVGSDIPVGTYADQLLEHTEGDIYLQFEIARPKDKDDDFDADSWVFLSKLFPFISAIDFYKQYLKGQSLKDKIFMEQMAPKIAERFVQHLQFFAVTETNTRIKLPVDTTLVTDFVNDRPMYVSIRMAGALPAIKRKDIKYIEISDISGLLNLSFLNILPAGSKVIVTAGNMRYRTKYSSGYLFRDARIMNDLMGGDAARVYTPLSREELRNPREEDKEVSRALLDHLNEHLEHYHHALWWRMSPDRRYMLLDGFEAPNSGGRSVASVVENELIGIVGNSFIMPVARGFHLDPTFRQDAEKPVDLFEHYEPSTPIEPSRVAIPTRGVYAEAVMGVCNSCEFKEEERFWRWEESPIPDVPTPILPVSTESRRAEPTELTAKDYPPPMINLQNAPAAPDPTGLAAAMQLLGTPNLFKDITGLEGTQRNAAAALQGAFDTAKFFGGKAADLALQGKMTRDIDKTMRAIDTAHQRGMITDDDVRVQTNRALSGLTGAGANESQPLSKGDVQDLTDTAGQNSASVSVSRPTGERVDVDARDAEILPDGTRRPTITFSATTNAPDTRAFRPASLDRSGVISVQASVRNAPSGATYRWSTPDTDHITINTPTALGTRIRAMKPGKATLHFGVFKGGNEVASSSLELSVPQFILVKEDTAAFDGVLSAMHVQGLKDGIVRKIREVCDSILKVGNVRTVWQVGPFKETLPTHLPVATHVTTATIMGEPPGGSHLLGATHAVNGLGGPDVPNEKIEIFPGGYDNPLPPNADPAAYDVDEESLALAIELTNRVSSEPTLEAFATEVIGRLVGETLAHEIGHSLLWELVDPSGHNNPKIDGDLMNTYHDRPLKQRTGFEDTSHTSPVDPANFIDHGIGAIGGFTGANKAHVVQHFPVPPDFK